MSNAQPQTVAIPKLEQYTVLEKIAVGGMAAIFVAQRNGSREICVIKTLHDHYAQDNVVGNRFLREAQVAALLSHPNVARLTDAKREDHVLFLAMEYIAGQDMETIMFKLMESRRMLPPGLTCAVAVDVLQGLHYAHDFRQGDEHLEIVHRDLSPRNVMIGYDGQTKVIDFGLARTTLGDFRTAPGMVLGTLRYMSPEQATAEPVDRRSDIYSFGTVIYEALSGRPFVRGNDAKEIMHGILTQQALPLSAVNGDLPTALDPVLAKAMAKKRTDRFSTAEEFRQALLAAAPALCGTPRSQVGDFVRKLYVSEYTKSVELMSRAAQGDISGAVSSDEPVFEPTRAGVPMAQEDAPAIVAPPISQSIDDVPAAAQYAATQTRRQSFVAPAPVAPPKKKVPIAVIVAAALAVAATAAVFAIGKPTSPPPTPQAALEPAKPPVRVVEGVVEPTPETSKKVSKRRKRSPTKKRRVEPSKATRVAKPKRRPNPRAWDRDVDALIAAKQWQEALQLMQNTAAKHLDSDTINGLEHFLPDKTLGPNLGDVDKYRLRLRRALERKYEGEDTR